MTYDEARAWCDENNVMYTEVREHLKSSTVFSANISYGDLQLSHISLRPYSKEEEAVFFPELVEEFKPLLAPYQEAKAWCDEKGAQYTYIRSFQGLSTRLSLGKHDVGERYTRLPDLGRGSKGEYLARLVEKLKREIAPSAR